MKLYIVHSKAPREEHLYTMFIAAESPEQAFEQWTGHYGYPWPCSMNEVPSLPTEAGPVNWNPPVRFPEEGQDTELPIEIARLNFDEDDDIYDDDEDKADILRQVEEYLTRMGVERDTQQIDFAFKTTRGDAYLRFTLAAGSITDVEQVTPED